MTSIEIDEEARALLREKEYRACARSFRYFFQNYWRIVLPASNTFGLPDLRPEQLETADIFQSDNRVVVLKARQIGWSTVVAAYLFWKAFFAVGQSCLVLSKKEDPDALLIIRAIKRGYDGLPEWMRERGTKVKRDTQTLIEFENYSTIESDAPSDNPARGRTLQLLVLDEFGAFPDPEGAWGSALPAIEWGQLFVIGNADRMHSPFHKLYTEAKAGKTNFRSLFYSWRVVAGRDEAWLASETSSYTPAERARQYPDNDEECWIAAGSPVFDPKVILSKLPLEGTPCVLRNGHPVPDENGLLRIWHLPVANMRYGIGVDPATGLEHGDDSVAVVMDYYNRVCAVLQGKIGSRELARLTTELGRFYNGALLGIERNNSGGAVIDFARDEFKYPNLYWRKDPLTISGQKPREWGWHTGEDTKGLAINYLAGKLPEIELTDAKVLKQLGEYRYIFSKTGTKVTMGGSPHDDLVMGLAIAAQMVREIRLPVGFGEGPPVPELPPSRFEGFDGTIDALARMGLEDHEVTSVGSKIVVMGGGGRRSLAARRW